MNTPSTRRDKSSVRRKTLVDTQPRPRVLPEPVFRGMLRTQQKRAHRAGERIALLIVSADHHRDAESPAEWAAVLDAVGVATRGTDIIGWFEWRTRIGIILTDIGGSSSSHGRDVEKRLNEELVRRLDDDMLRRFAISFHLDAEDPVFADAGPTSPVAYAPIKRTLDIVGSGTLLLILLPLLAVIAALVKLTSRGPVLFEQERVGRGLKRFKMLKFRTMRSGADSAIHQQYMTWYINSSSGTTGSQPHVFKMTADPRITPIGRLLRKTSLDELPQLWNVVRGDMSLVGPRPPLPYEVAQYKPWHCRRVVEATPGITGLWQVSGRSRTTFDDMVRLDLRYARSCSLWTDLRILLATPRAVVSGNGAC